MKKIMVALLAVAMAAIANAAVVNWSITGVTAPTGETLKSGWTAVYVLGDAVPSGFTTAAQWKTWASDSADSTGSLAVSARAKNYTGTSTATFDAGASVKGFIVMFDASDIGSANYYAVTTPTTMTVPAAGNLGWSQTFNASGASWQPISVPEPTSGLLLLLGMAGLALRRRRA